MGQPKEQKKYQRRIGLLRIGITAQGLYRRKEEDLDYSLSESVEVRTGPQGLD
jgi:hypothetical protein